MIGASPPSATAMFVPAAATWPWQLPPTIPALYAPFGDFAFLVARRRHGEPKKPRRKVKSPIQPTAQDRPKRSLTVLANH
jgi:hypothetical protein